MRVKIPDIVRERCGVRCAVFNNPLLHGFNCIPAAQSLLAAFSDVSSMSIDVILESVGKHKGRSHRKRLCEAGRCAASSGGGEAGGPPWYCGTHCCSIDGNSRMSLVLPAKYSKMIFSVRKSRT